MQLEFTSYSIPLLIGAALLAVIALIVWQRRNTPAAIYLFWACILLLPYLIGYALEVSSTTARGAAFWLKVEYLGIPFAVPMLFMMIVTYVGSGRWLTRLRCALLLVIPAITVLLAWTNAYHELIWRNITIDRSQGFTGTLFDEGLWYWVQFGYNYLLIALSLMLLLQAAQSAKGVYRRQIGIFLLSMSAPVIANIMYVADWTPQGLDVTTYGFLVLIPTATIGMFYYRLFDVAPVAHEAVFDSMLDAVLVVDNKHRLISANPAARKLLQLSDESIGRPLAYGQPKRLQPLADFLSSELIGTELVLNVPQPRYYDVRSQYIGRHVGGYVLVLRDVTARRLIEQEQLRLIEDLDAFAHTVAHDLKNPLTVLGSYGMMLQEEHRQLSDEELDEYLGYIVQYGHKMTHIINEILLLAGMRSLDHRKMGALNMAAIVAEAQARVLTLVEQRHAQIVTPDIWPRALGYAPWVEEIWANYISNAIKYGGDPPVLELGADTLPGGMLRFWVRDNGAGLTADQQRSLFTPFTRLASHRMDGHGLGLSIVRRIADKLGSSVGVESAPGAGSLFYFTLPPVRD